MRVAKEICKEITEIRIKGIDPVAFERAKKSMYGRNVASLNSAENIANSLVSLTFANRELFQYLDAIANATIGQAEQALQKQLREEYSALSVVTPIKEESYE